MKSVSSSHADLLGALFEEPPGVEGVLTLGGYELLEEIASGGMGIVWRAWHPALDRTVALKTIRSAHLARAQDVARFKTEATSAARLRHPHIVTVHDIGDEDGQHYFTMELVEGPSLAQRLGEGPLQPVRAATLVRDTARAVQHAHEQGILHRDLKPSNILLRPDGAPCVSDFGLAKALTHDSELTLTGTVLGSPAYMPPEQAQGNTAQLDARSDVYALGAVLYECLTGRPPFQGGTPVQTLKLVVDQEPAPPRLTRRDISRDLEIICLKCLAKEPGRRYQTAAALAEDLNRYLRHEPILAQPVGLPGRLRRWARRKPAVALLLLACVAVAAAGIAGIVHQWRRAVANEQQAFASQREARAAEYDAALQLADEALRNNRPTLVRELLQRTTPAPGEPDLRGWEWHYLLSQLHSQQRRTLLTTPEAMDAIAIAPDGTALAAAAGLRLHLLDLPSGQVRTAGALPAKARMLAFSPDGKTVAAILDGQRITVHDAVTAASGWLLKLEENPSCILFAGDSDTLLINSTDHEWRWSVSARKLLGKVKTRHSVGSVLHAATGRALYSPGELNSLVFRQPDGRLSEPWLWPDGTFLTGLFFSPSGASAASLFSDGTVQVWDSATARIRHTLRGHQQIPFVAAFHPHQPLLATAGHDESIFLWNTEKGEWIRHWHGHRGRITALACAPDGEMFYSAGADGTLREWDAAELTPPGCSTPTTPGYAASAWSADGRSLLEFMPGGKFIYRGPGGMRWEWSGSGHSKMQLTPDGSHLVLASPSQWEVRRRGVSGFTTAARLSADLSGLYAMETDSTGTRLAALFRSGEVSIRSLPTLEERHRFTIPAEFKGDLCEFTFTPDGRHLFTARIHRGCEVRELDTGRIIASVPPHPGGIHRAAVSPDLTTFALTAHDRPVEIWKAASDGTAVFHSLLSRYIHSGVCAAFAPDGRRLAIGCNNGAVFVVNAHTLAPLARLHGHSFEYSRITFSPDGRAISACSRPELNRWSWE